MRFGMSRKKLDFIKKYFLSKYGPYPPGLRYFFTENCPVLPYDSNFE